MKICVHGLWHLGSVTAACLADLGFETIGLDPDEKVIANLRAGKPPLFEPGLGEMVANGVAVGTLRFTADTADAIGHADLVWVSFDTPVDNEDRADVGYVRRCVEETFPHLRDGAVVLVSSQMPVGSVAALERSFAAVAGGRKVSFCCSPENLRLGNAIAIFKSPGRIVMGVRDDGPRAKLEPVLSRICDNIIWVSVESAEMTKHALNAFLATTVTYINEVATVCEQVGADAREVERAVRSDPRVGPKVYLSPGAAFAGGTLARDVVFLNEIAHAHNLALPMLGHLLASNAEHRMWALRRLAMSLGDLRGQTVAILGLSYKPGTSSLRRSIAVEIAVSLLAVGAKVRAFDPVAKELSDDLARITLAQSALEALEGACAVVIATEWPEFRELSAADFVRHMKRPLLLDASRFLAKSLGDANSLEYVSVGSQG